MKQPKLMDFVKEIEYAEGKKTAAIDFAGYAFALEEWIREQQRAAQWSKTEADQMVLKALRFYQDKGSYGTEEAGQLNRLIKALE